METHSKTRKVFVDDDGNLSVVESTSSVVSVDHTDGRTIYASTPTRESFEKLRSMAKQERKLPQSEVSKIKEEHLAREKQKEDNKRNG